MEHMSPAKEFKWEVRVVLINKTGLHSRPVGAFNRVAKMFKSDIKVICKDKDADGKKTLPLLNLNANKGDTLDIIAIGPDAFDAATELKKLVENKFGEPE